MIGRAGTTSWSASASMANLALKQLHANHPLKAPSAEMVGRALERSQLYSEELGIDLAKRSDAGYFRWFLASLLFGARISEAIAKDTYRSFIRHGLTSPKKILDAGWDYLVYPVMREGGYVRYDGRKSTQVLRNCEMLTEDYGGSLKRLHDAARSARELEESLLGFHGVGPITANIFLREMRPYWAKADPEPLPCVKRLAKRLAIDLRCYRRKSLTFARVEAGLIRRRHELAS
jgi:endonuclease III